MPRAHKARVASRGQAHRWVLLEVSFKRADPDPSLRRHLQAKRPSVPPRGTLGVVYPPPSPAAFSREAPQTDVFSSALCPPRREQLRTSVLERISVWARKRAGSVMIAAFLLFSLTALVAFLLLPDLRGRAGSCHPGTVVILGGWQLS